MLSAQVKGVDMENCVTDRAAGRNGVSIFSPTKRTCHRRALQGRRGRCAAGRNGVRVSESCVSAQVTGVDMQDGVVDVRLAEMVVSGLALRYVDRKTGDTKEEGRTRPDVIMRQLTTRPGQARPVKASINNLRLDVQLEGRTCSEAVLRTPARDDCCQGQCPNEACMCNLTTHPIKARSVTHVEAMLRLF